MTAGLKLAVINAPEFQIIQPWIAYTEYTYATLSNNYTCRPAQNHHHEVYIRYQKWNDISVNYLELITIRYRSYVVCFQNNIEQFTLLQILVPYFKTFLYNHYRLNQEGSVERIVYNNPVRDTFLTVQMEKVNALYKALCLFDALLYNPENHVRMKLNPGKSN